MNRILTSSVRSVCNSKTLFGRRSTKGARNYASMQDLKLRIGVVESVEKITSSMKMVSAAKLKVAQGHVDPAVRFFESTKRVFTDLEADPEALKDLQAESTADADAPHMIVAITTDRGLCGAITSNVCRVAVEQAKTHRKENVVFSSLGTKGQDNLVGQNQKKKLSLIVADLHVKQPSFAEVAYIADTILARNISGITVIYNHFVNMLTNEMRVVKFLSIDELKSASKWQETEFDGEDAFQSLNEFYFASALWAAILDNSCCEQAVRMTAMDGASSNAADLVESLSLEYNKTRQAAITTELSEIVGGMAAILEN